MRDLFLFFIHPKDLGRNLSYKVVRSFIAHFSDIEITSERTHAEVMAMQGFEEFAYDQVKERAPYLLDEDHRAMAKKIELDERSTYFIAIENDQIVGSVRLTPYLFEFSLLSEKFQKLSQGYQDYYEISRLYISSEAKSRRRVAQLLLFQAGSWLFNATQAKGIIGICREERLRYFKNFGMNIIGEDFVSLRGAKYTVVCATQSEMLFKALANVYRSNKEKLISQIKTGNFEEILNARKTKI